MSQAAARSPLCPQPLCRGSRLPQSRGPGPGGRVTRSLAAGRPTKQARLLGATEVLVEAGLRGLTDVFQDEPFGGGSAGSGGQGGGPPTGPGVAAPGAGARPRPVGSQRGGGAAAEAACLSPGSQRVRKERGAAALTTPQARGAPAGGGGDSRRPRPQARLAAPSGARCPRGWAGPALFLEEAARPGPGGMAGAHPAAPALCPSPQEAAEVTLKTEVEAGASGYSVTGGGDRGIFVQQVLKGSSAAKLFSLREGALVPARCPGPRPSLPRPRLRCPGPRPSLPWSPPPLPWSPPPLP